MRGIYNLEILKIDSCAPIRKKIYGTFFSIFIISSIIGCLFFFGRMHQELTHAEVFFIMKNISITWFFIVISIFFALNLILKNCISPLVKIIISSTDLKSLQEVELPTTISQEIQLLFNLMQKSFLRLNEFQNKAIEVERNSAIAKTVQMLAHDVRKPFTILKMALDIISQVENSDEIRKLIKSFLPIVQKELNFVNSLIHDLMEIGNTTIISCEEIITPQDLFCVSLTDIFRVYLNSEINFHFDLQHKHSVKVNEQKILRVFSNLIINAAQSIGMKGDIYFITKDTLKEKKSYVTFTIRNSGAFIPESDRIKIFEAFFTKGKDNGTGLGLAIAKKIIEEHNCEIWCDSGKNTYFKNGFVEFNFTLPAEKIKNEIDLSLLPKNSRQIFQYSKSIGVR